MILAILYVVTMFLWGIYLVTEPRSKRDILAYIAAVIAGWGIFAGVF